MSGVSEIFCIFSLAECVKIAGMMKQNTIFFKCNLQNVFLGRQLDTLQKSAALCTLSYWQRH
jgi:hypothetical protein